MKTKIIKKLLFCILLLFFGHFSFGQTYMLELKADGSEIPEGSLLEKEHVTWSVKDATGRTVNDVDAYATGMGDFVSNLLMFDINHWVPAPGIGTTITFTVTVKSGPYAGFSGTKSYVIDGGNIDDFLPEGLNLVRPSSFYHFNKFYEHGSVPEYCNRAYVGGKYERWRYPLEILKQSDEIVMGD